MKLLYLLIMLFVVFAAIVLLIRGIESRSIFFPMKGKPAATDMPVPHEEVWLKAADGTKLQGWFVPRAKAMVHRNMPFIPAFALATRLDSLSRIRRVSAPKLIFHSIDDEIVPFEMGEKLFAAASEPKRFVQLHGGHNTAFFDDLRRYRAELSDFIRSIPPPEKR